MMILFVLLRHLVQKPLISIIRISGKGCIDFVQSFFTGNLNKKSQTISYGYIVDGEEKVDEVLISIYRGKHTFTGEEMVEINCHGGVFITNKVLFMFKERSENG